MIMNTGKEKKEVDIFVSVIVPIYNVEKYLNDCLSSLERQTLKNIEVILINDGSTDNSRKIAKEYVERDVRFKLIDCKSGGLSAARNVELYQRAEDEQLDVLKFSAYVFEDGKDSEMTWERYKYLGTYPDIYTGIELLRRMRECQDGFPSSCMIFTRRDVIADNALGFYEGIIHEDNLFHWTLMAVSKRVCVLNKPLYCRRIRMGSITTNPQYYNKWKSFILSTVEADRFYYSHVELIGSGIDINYHEFLLQGITGGYLLMEKNLRWTKEARRLHKIERKLIFKWHTEMGKEIILYAVSPKLYIFYMNMIDIAKTKLQ